MKQNRSNRNITQQTANTATQEEGIADNIHVLPLGNGWVVKASKANTFTAITDSKSEAISIARTLAKTKHTRMIVHGKDGAIEIKENYLL